MCTTWVQSLRPRRSCNVAVLILGTLVSPLTWDSTDDWEGFSV